MGEALGFQSASYLEIYLIGDFKIRSGDNEADKNFLHQRKGRNIIKLLALTPGHSLFREQIIDILWTNVNPEKAINSLYNSLYLLRRGLEQAGIDPGDVLLVHEGVVQLCPDKLSWIDLEYFNTTADEAIKNRDHSLCLAALELANKDLLTENRYDDWAIVHCDAFCQQILKLKRLMADLLMEQEDWESACQMYSQILSQDPLDEQSHAGLMRAYVHKGQRNRAINQYQALQKILLEELETVPSPQVTHLFEDIRDGKISKEGMLTGESPERRKSKLSNNHLESLMNRDLCDFLPTPISSFLGREFVISEILKLIHENRLVTLAGAGGVGKTRLALEVAGQLIKMRLSEDGDDRTDLFPDGVWYLELATISDGELMVQEFAHLFGIQYLPKGESLGFLTNFLYSKHALIVLDNCEYLVDSCAHLVQRLLNSCRKLRILITSRKVLGVNGELVYYVPPMRYADPDSIPDIQVFTNMEAVMLFTQRARLVAPDFQITHENARTIAQICKNLDGLPLAIEMAAARLNILSLEQIKEKTTEAVNLLSRSFRTSIPHHKTMLASLDWSYALLTEDEVRLLRRLSVFLGGSDLVGIKNVCSDYELKKDAILDCLAGLVEKSLIYTRQNFNGDRRYCLLETVRQYANQKLLMADESVLFHDRHRDFYLGIAEESRNGIWTGERMNWTWRLKGELDNLRAAIRWSYQNPQDIEKGLRLAEAISRRFMQVMGLNAEACNWLEQGLLAESVRSIPELLQAKSMGTLAWLEYMVGNHESARKWAWSSMQICLRIGDEARAEHSWSLWIQAELSDDLDLARRFVDKAVELARNVTGLEKWYLPCCLQSYAPLSICCDQKIFDCLSEKFRLHWEMGDRWSCAGALWHRAECYKKMGDLDRALIDSFQALELCLDAEDRISVFISYRVLFTLYYKKGDTRKCLLMAQEALKAFYPGVGPRIYREVFIALVSVYSFLLDSSESFSDDSYITAGKLLGFTERSASEQDPDFLTFRVDSGLDQALHILHKHLVIRDLDDARKEGFGLSLDQAVRLALSIDPGETIESLWASMRINHHVLEEQYSNEY